MTSGKPAAALPTGPPPYTGRVQTVHRGFAWFVCLMGLLLVSRANSAVADAQDRAGAIGLLPIPPLFETYDCATLRSRKPIPVFVGARDRMPAGRLVIVDLYDGGVDGCTTSTVAVQWSADRPAARLLTDEYDDETLAAIVLARRGLRFRVALSTGSAWIDGDRSLYRPAVALLTRAGLSVREAELPLIRKTPGGSRLRVTLNPDYRALSGRLVATTRYRGRLWVKVVFEGDCGIDNPPSTPRAGWLPFHDAAGVPTVWFSSRGC